MDDPLAAVRAAAGELQDVPSAEFVRTSRRKRKPTLGERLRTDEGMTPFDAFHAAAETRGTAVLSSENDYDTVGVERIPLEPTGE